MGPNGKNYFGHAFIVIGVLSGLSVLAIIYGDLSNGLGIARSAIDVLTFAVFIIVPLSLLILLPPFLQWLIKRNNEIPPSP